MLHLFLQLLLLLLYINSSLPLLLLRLQPRPLRLPLRKLHLPLMLLAELRSQTLGILPIGFGLLDGGGLLLAQAGEFLLCVLQGLLLLGLCLGKFLACEL